MNIDHRSLSSPNELDGLNMDDILIYGMEKAPTSVSYAGTTLTNEQLKYDASNKVATLTNLRLPMTSNWSLNFNF